MSMLKDVKSKLLIFILISLIIGAVLGMIVSLNASAETTAKLISIAESYRYYIYKTFKNDSNACNTIYFDKRCI